MPYSYADRDLLSDPPFHYMFSSFEGPQFFRDYIFSRQNARKRLGASVTPVQQGDITVPLPDAGAAEVRTDDILSQLVEAVRAGSTTHVRAWVDLFVLKFEASKRLRRSYGRGFKPLDRTVLGRNAYAQLAFLVASVMRGPTDLRLLNTLLKLNDLVLSGAQFDEATATLMGPAIDREMACVRELATRLRVTAPEQAAC